ncbi:hypothetical protein RvY_16791 [Ramazzottius varieornatus]|uniref:MAM domain-containing protein n=1 Tax=Ramazzottius varieornatus TaxID=947166 RepID=A0A1D1VZT4_RAMVA|nr:hypothetical protein RvY_16791 [Ramazzottius varieornatus]
MVPARSRLLALVLKLCSIWLYTVKAGQARDVSECVLRTVCQNDYYSDPSRYQKTDKTSALSCSFSRSLGVYDITDPPAYRRLPKCGGNGKEWTTPSHTSYQFVASQWSKATRYMDTVASNCTAVNRDSSGQNYHAWLRTGLFNGSSDGCSCFRLTVSFLFSGNSQPWDQLEVYFANVNDNGQEEDRVLLWKYTMNAVDSGGLQREITSFFARRNSFYIYFEAKHQKCDGSSIHLTAVTTTVGKSNMLKQAISPEVFLTSVLT